MTERNVPKVMDGRKWQTRRIIRLYWSGRGRNRYFSLMNPETDAVKNGKRRVKWHDYRRAYFLDDLLALSPYNVGDMIYIKEALQRSSEGGGVVYARYKTDNHRVKKTNPRHFRRWESDSGKPWKPRILPARYMPRSAARSFIEITNVRCEQIQSITETDCQAEGCHYQGTMAGSESTKTSYRGAFRDLWDSTNGKGAWKRNDWVYAYDFKLTDKV